jgi:hypothetical protein
MSNIGSDLRQAAVDAGARFRATEKVDLLTIERACLTWFSANIQAQIGVLPKPQPGSTCPICQKQKQAFELDHMGPWRVYVAAAAGPHIQRDPTTMELLIDRDMVKVLYNDPANLWWICSNCNSTKSNRTYDTAAQLLALQNGQVPQGQKGINPSQFVK